MWGLFKKKTLPPIAGSVESPAKTETPSITDVATALPAEALHASDLVPAPVAEEKKGWLDKLKTGLTATRNKLGLNVLFAGKLDDDTLEQLEAQLLMADCGMLATQHLLDDLRKRRGIPWRR